MLASKCPHSMDAALLEACYTNKPCQMTSSTMALYAPMTSNSSTVIFLCPEITSVRKSERVFLHLSRENGVTKTPYNKENTQRGLNKQTLMNEMNNPFCETKNKTDLKT